MEFYIPCFTIHLSLSQGWGVPCLPHNVFPSDFIQERYKLFSYFEEIYYYRNRNSLCSSKCSAYVRAHLSVFSWNGEWGQPLCSDSLKQAAPASDCVCWRSWETVRSWAESSLHRSVISEPFWESFQVSRRSAARMHFWSSCLKIWGKLGWKNNHMILQLLKYFWLSDTKSNMTWQPYTTKTLPSTEKLTDKKNGEGDIHPPFPFFIYAYQSFLASNTSGGSENIPQWLWLWCRATCQLTASCLEHGWALWTSHAWADLQARTTLGFWKVWMSLSLALALHHHTTPLKIPIGI